MENLDCDIAAGVRMAGVRMAGARSSTILRPESDAQVLSAQLLRTSASRIQIAPLGIDPMTWLLTETGWLESRRVATNSCRSPAFEDALAPLVAGQYVELFEIGDETGLLDAADIIDLDEGTAAVVIEWVNGTTGMQNPVQVLASLCCRTNIPIILDSRHALGAVPIDFNQENVAAIAAVGQSWLGTRKPCGFVYTNPNRWHALSQASPSPRQELATNVAGLLHDGYYRRIARVVQLHRAVTEVVDHFGCRRLSPDPGPSAAGIVTFEIPGVSAAVAVRFLAAEFGIVCGELGKCVRISPDPVIHPSELSERLAAALHQFGLNPQSPKSRR